MEALATGTKNLITDTKNGAPGTEGAIMITSTGSAAPGTETVHMPSMNASTCAAIATFGELSGAAK
ncbi:hypothetical protein AA309_10115 [Microvirga vignae]|uniref:Uncharacterized protein n=1 Tax=Microvirga vignae TaxID=1225564 RepID=A0A0H1RD69_9HYPH|nr:hypothetical protein AA309_10115 [Microvirga vignae]